MLLLLVGKLHENLFAFGILEALSVFLEEPVRSALAFDADEQRLLVVDALAEPIGSFGEKTVCRALKEEERGARLELRVHLEQLGVSPFERTEMLLLFFGKFLEDGAAASILRDTRGAGVELKPAALGRDRDAQRVARKNHLGRTTFDGSRFTGLAFFARAVNLHHALLAGELSRGRDLFNQRFDIRAEKLEGLIARLADEVEMAGMAIRMLEPEAAFAEIDLAGDPGVHHPL